jgi:hypothetical protein
MNSKRKIKNAFYNCFALVVRVKFNTQFYEIHIKVFNTGKIEIPGILNSDILNIVKQDLLLYIQPFISTPLKYINDEVETNVLINSNFNCGFYINRDKLYNILRSNKYNIETAFEPCSYPGVKCKFYYNNEYGLDPTKQNGLIERMDHSMTVRKLQETKKYTEISFMIFRTGSCLIVGNCSEEILRFIYEFIKQILLNEYHNIVVDKDITVSPDKKIKLRKKHIIMSNEYYQKHIVK